MFDYYIPISLEKKQNSLNRKDWKENLIKILSKYMKSWKMKYVKTYDSGTASHVSLVSVLNKEYILKIDLDTVEDKNFFDKQIKFMKNFSGDYPIIYKYNKADRICLMQKLNDTLKSYNYDSHKNTKIIYDLMKKVLQSHIPLTNTIKQQVNKDLKFWKNEVKENDVSQHIYVKYHDFLNELISKINWNKLTYIHGDLHTQNVLYSKETKSFKLIDPDGIIFMPEFELGKLLSQVICECCGNMEKTDVIKTINKECKYLAMSSKYKYDTIYKWFYVNLVGTTIYCKNLDIDEWHSWMKIVNLLN
ncbi:MAG: hypothetical protein Ta2E_03180 [Mycoplasmoidaceae bacterium]|nr:MAG: hypothetical protein Ta2E_03180 [Mycoplasmoidaceae bacterium]